MVFFTCSGCGESLRRVQIQKHVMRCGGARVFSCIDCGTDYHGEDYKSHMKCISEDQKYGGKNYEAKANKGDLKQQQWIQRIQEVLSKPGVNGRLKSVLQQVASYDNVPRKKAKFQNWMKNSLRIYEGNLQEQVWEIFSTTNTSANGEEAANTPQQPEEQKEPQEAEREKKKKKSERAAEREQEREKKRSKDQQQGGEEHQRKKRRRREEECEEEEELEKTSTRIKKKKRNQEKAESLREEEEEEEEEEKANSKGKFNWKGTIKAVLHQAPEEGISVKKLRKKVLSAYGAHSGERNHRSEEELYTLFNKKLRNPKFRTLKDKVRLVQ